MTLRPDCPIAPPPLQAIRGLGLAILLLIGSATIGGAAMLAAEDATGASPSPAAIDAIRRVLAHDELLGKERNHAPEQGSLAEAVHAYAEALAELDFTDCPADFVAAFGRHQVAWEESIPFFEGHGEMRGEMHQLFAAIREMGGNAGRDLQQLEDEIWATWAEVEDAVRRASADPADQE